MADEQNNGKSGDVTKIVVALITLAGTVATGWFGYAAMTYKNDQQPGEESRDGPDVSQQNKANEGTGPEESEEGDPPDSIADINGDWITDKGATVTFTQDGSDFKVQQQLGAGKPVTHFGEGIIEGGIVRWKMRRDIRQQIKTGFTGKTRNPVIMSVTGKCTAQLNDPKDEMLGECIYSTGTISVMYQR